VGVYLLALGPVLGREGSRGFSNYAEKDKERRVEEFF
jgi:hypothetical protein